jgi:hypothetical protein
MLLRPTLHTQRCVEQVSFVPSGGHQWTRSLQVQVPLTATPSERTWWIVPLGTYAPRRFPDLTVLDARGGRINLLTRHQHGVALTRAMLNIRLADLLSTGYLAANRESSNVFYRELWKALYASFTTAGEPSPEESTATLEDLTSRFRDFLRSLRVSSYFEDAWLATFVTDIVEAVGTTKYLCWVSAAPGEIVNLQVSYTAEDTKHELERGNLRTGFSRLLQGLVEPRYERRPVWADWYRQLGIAPLNYEFNVPSQRHTGSYYFVIEPPAGSYVTYLDWEVSNSLTDKEVDCAFPSAHIHNGNNSPGISASRGGTIRAYIRCAPHHHKQIIGAALLNASLVYVLVTDRLPASLSDSTQSLLLAVPSIVTAYLVQQQKHYHAHATRRQRAILWVYLSISVTFFIAISFGRHEGTLGSRGLGPFASVVTWLLGATSAGVLVWYLPQGYSFARLTEALTRRRKVKVEKRLERDAALTQAEIDHMPELVREAVTHRKESTQAWRCYERAVHQYCSTVFRCALVAAVAALIGVHMAWSSAPKQKLHSREQLSEVDGSLTVHSWPSELCKDCNVELRFVPTSK